VRNAITELADPSMLQDVHAERRDECQQQHRQTRPQIDLHDYTSTERIRSR
jgi:hypothetical protein